MLFHLQNSKRTTILSDPPTINLGDVPHPHRGNIFHIEFIVFFEILDDFCTANSSLPDRARSPRGRTEGLLYKNGRCGRDVGLQGYSKDCMTSPGENSMRLSALRMEWGGQATNARFHNNAG